MPWDPENSSSAPEVTPGDPLGGNNAVTGYYLAYLSQSADLLLIKVGAVYNRGGSRNHVMGMLYKV